MHSASSLSSTSAALIHRYVNTIGAQRNLSPVTCKVYLRNLLSLDASFAERRISLLTARTQDIADELVGVRPVSAAHYVTSIKGFFEFLIKEGIVKKNPTTALQRPKFRRGYNLSRLLTLKELQAIFNSPDFSAMGRRNHLILRCLAMTEIKTSRLATLTLNQIDLITGQVSGLRRKGRAMPVIFKRQLLEEVREYIRVYRKSVVEKDIGYLFPSQRQKPLCRQAIWHIIAKCVKEAGINKQITSNDLRRSYRTHCVR